MNRQVQIALFWGVALWLVGCTPLIAPPQAATIPAPATVAPADAGPDFTGMTVDQWESTPPDQAWTATGTVAIPPAGGEQYYTALRVTNAAGTHVWTPVAGWSTFGLGYTTPRVVQWSSDGAALYFTNAPVPDGCGLFVNASDLQKLDLATGVVTEILPVNSTWALAAAPDGTIAYIQGQALKLLDPTTDNTTGISLELAATNVQIGNLVWSPDSQQVAFTVASAPCQPPDWRHAIYVVTRDGLTVHEVLPPDERRLTILAWPTTDSLLLRDREGKEWVLELASGAVRVADTTALCLPALATACVMSPNEERVAVIDDGGLLLKGPGLPTQSLFPRGDSVSTVVWSPDSQFLIVLRNGQSPLATAAMPTPAGPPALWQVDLTANAVITPTQLFGPEQLPGDPAFYMPGQIVFGDWSPDGQHLLFWVGPLSASILADGLPLYGLQLQTGEVTLLAAAALNNPGYHSWAPDSSALIYTAGGYRSAQVGKWLAHWDTATRQITTVISETEQVPGLVAWSPAGDQIAYAAVAAALTGPDWADAHSFTNQAIAGRRIYLLDPVTGATQRLNQVESYQDAPVWDETGQQLFYVQREGEEMVLMVADPKTGDATPVADARQPLPDTPGYYGQGEWTDLLLRRPN